MTRLLLLLLAALVAVPSASAQRCNLSGNESISQSAVRGVPGDQIRLSYTFVSVGDGPCPETTTGHYLSTDNFISSDDILLDTAPLPAGQPQTNLSGAVTVTIPDGTSRGGYRILVVADYLDAVPEDTQGDNVSYGSLTVGGDVNGPNLVIATAQLESNTVALGSRLSVDYSVQNQGRAGVGDVTVSFYLAEFNTPPSQWRRLGSEVIGNVEAGGTERENEQLPIPSDVPLGEYGFLVWVDANNAIEESIETDNTFGLGPVTVTGATAGAEAPSTFALSLAASPNPSAGAVRVSYSLAEAWAVRLALVDGLGREVAIVEGARAAGPHAEALDVSRLAPGVYVLRLAAGSETAARTLTVVR